MGPTLLGGVLEDVLQMGVHVPDLPVRSWLVRSFLRLRIRSGLRRWSIAPWPPADTDVRCRIRHRHPSMPDRRLSRRAPGPRTRGRPRRTCRRRAHRMIGAGSTVEQVAIEDGQVGELADLERAGLVVEVVHVGRSDRERRERVDQVQPLLGQEDRPIAGVLDRCLPLDRDVHLPDAGSGSRRSNPSPWRGPHRRPAASGTGTAIVQRSPRKGIVRMSSWSSWAAHSGWALAATSSCRNRGMSSGWMTWMWAICGRVSEGPFARRAASTASSEARTARSPIAWKCGWKPSASSFGTQVARAVRVDLEEAAVVGRAALAVAVRLEHRAGEVLEDAVHHQLDARRSVPPDRCRPTALDEFLDLLAAARSLPPHRPDDAAGQLAARSERDVGALLGRAARRWRPARR